MKVSDPFFETVVTNIESVSEVVKSLSDVNDLLKIESWNDQSWIHWLIRMIYDFIVIK